LDKISDGERAAWANGDRAERYREHASRLQQLAGMETHHGVRERLLEVAGQYLELADRVAGGGKPLAWTALGFRFLLRPVGESLKFGRHDPELVRQPCLMGVRHLAQATSALSQELHVPM
jgi:hypothetical protein